MEQEESGPCLQTTLQSYSHQKQHFLAQNRNKDEWNRIQSPEINHAPSSIHLWQRRQGYTVLEKQSLQQMVQRNLNSYIQKKKKKKEEIRSFFNTTHKNKLSGIFRFQCKGALRQTSLRTTNPGKQQTLREQLSLGPCAQESSLWNRVCEQCRPGSCQIFCW